MADSKFVPQSVASKAASNAAFKRFSERLSKLHTEIVEKNERAELERLSKKYADSD